MWVNLYFFVSGYIFMVLLLVSRSVKIEKNSFISRLQNGLSKYVHYADVDCE